MVCYEYEIASNNVSELEHAVIVRDVIIRMLRELQAEEPSWERDFKVAFLQARLADAHAMVGAAIRHAEQRN